MKEKNWEKMANECRELDKEKRRKDERSEQKKKKTRVAKIINKGCRFTGEALAALPLLS